MESMKSFLLERYINIFPSKNPDLARTHVDAAWDILQSAYAKIGGTQHLKVMVGTSGKVLK